MQRPYTFFSIKVAGIFGLVMVAIALFIRKAIAKRNGVLSLALSMSILTEFLV
ncbi:hypothetical protein [Dapis sp. BLCC M172]|uniref:hypothetical protein n=1 Tax=Dapis sp. BLCC M172 TaxID=2975281 RepID=UPI003CF50D84